MAGSYVWWFSSWRAEIYLIRAWFMEGLGFGAVVTKARMKKDRKTL